MFYSVGRQQRRYEAPSHPHHCEMHEDEQGDCLDPALAGQSPLRLQLGVHSTVTLGSADLSYLDLGDAILPGETHAIEGVTDGTLLAHEYDHVILTQIEANPNSGWNSDSTDCCGSGPFGDASKTCERDALHEGLADAFAYLLTGSQSTLHARTVASPSAKRLAQLAQVAFAEENVFMPDAPCNGRTQQVLAKEKAQRELAVAGPITRDGSAAPPSFKAFIPQGV